MYQEKQRIGIHNLVGIVQMELENW